MHRLRFFIFAALILSLTACPHREPEGIVKQIIEPSMRVNHPLYYWETTGGETSLYRIPVSTSDIVPLLQELPGVRGVKSSGTSVYILSDDRSGHLLITRFESDRTMTTEARLSNDISAGENTIWDVSKNDTVAVYGTDSAGAGKVLRVDFTRKEPDESFRRDVVNQPVITFEESVWFQNEGGVAGLKISESAAMLALALPLNDGSGKNGLFILSGRDNHPAGVTDYPVIDLGGFSPDEAGFLATFELEGRVDVYLIDTATLSAEEITRVSTGFICGHPAWHPNGRYFFYTTNYTAEFNQNSTFLYGEQLFLYSIDSRNDRRLTAFDSKALWVDFAPNGDFLLYSSTPGVISRAGRGIVSEEERQRAAEQGLETWRIYYVIWDPEKFQSGSSAILKPDDTQFMIGYTAGGRNVIGFEWGP